MKLMIVIVSFMNHLEQKHCSAAVGSDGAVFVNGRFWLGSVTLCGTSRLKNMTDELIFECTHDLFNSAHQSHDAHHLFNHRSVF